LVGLSDYSISSHPAPRIMSASLFVAVALFCYSAQSVNAAAGDLFLSAAQKFINDKPAMNKLYLDHAHTHHSGKQERSELDDILEDMVEYMKENENAHAHRHVLTILSDDMGFSDIGFNDDTFFSPTLNAMCRHGVKLSKFYVQSTCSPTRASLITGRDVTKTGLQDAAIVPGESRYLDFGLKTAGQYFREAGYSTYFIGKWHLGQRYLNMTPTYRGYDYHFGILGGGIDSYTKRIGLLCGTAENNFTSVFGDNCQFINAYDFVENNVPYIDQVNYASDIFTDKATAIIANHDLTKPMLMHFHPNTPHAPLNVPDQYRDYCTNVGPGVTEGREKAIRPYFRQIICAMVADTDYNTLRILFALGLKGMLPHTMVAYHSDNGGLTLAGSVNGPFLGEKGSLFEGGIRVPAFMFGNTLHVGSAINGVRDNDFVLVSDVLPTILGYAGVTFGLLTNPFDGYNIYPNLVTGLPLQRNNVPVVSSGKVLGYASAFIQNIFGTTFKYMINPSVVDFVAISPLGESYKPEGEFLFNLSEDPYETTNLINNTDLFTMAVHKIMQLRVLLVQKNSLPSQLTTFPVINLPPSDLGCWLPLDSPLYSTFECPMGDGDPSSHRGLFKPGERFTAFGEPDDGVLTMGSGVGASDEYNQYITCDLDM
jgi:arylsulfatase A-like enzyme